MAEHARVHHEVQDDEPDAVSVLIGWTEPDRTQLVTLARVHALHEEWVRLMSWIGPADRLTPDAWAERDLQEPLGSACLREARMYLQITVPVDGLTPARLDELIQHIAQASDDLEEELYGTDDE